MLHVDSDGLDVQKFRCYGYIYITSLHVKLKAPLDTVYYGSVAGKIPRQLTSFLSSGSFFERTCPWSLLNSGSSRPHSVPPFLDPVVGVRYVRVRSGGFCSKDLFKRFLRRFKLICLCLLPLFVFMFLFFFFEN